MYPNDALAKKTHSLELDMPPMTYFMFLRLLAFGLNSWVLRPARTLAAKPNSEENLSNEVLCWTNRLGAKMHHNLQIMV